MAEMNGMHPFREGNGRALREFIRCLASANEYTFDWNKVNKDDLLNAIKLSVIDPNFLEQLIDQCIIEKEPSRKVIHLWKQKNIRN